MKAQTTIITHGAQGRVVIEAGQEVPSELISKLVAEGVIEKPSAKVENDETAQELAASKAEEKPSKKK